MTNPSNLVITGLDGYFILNFLQKSGFLYLLKTLFIIHRIVSIVNTFLKNFLFFLQVVPGRVSAEPPVLSFMPDRVLPASDPGFLYGS